MTDDEIMDQTKIDLVVNLYVQYVEDKQTMNYREDIDYGLLLDILNRWGFPDPPLMLLLGVRNRIRVELERARIAELARTRLLT